MYEFFAKNGTIVDQGNNIVNLKGVNFFGFETAISCLHGLWIVSLGRLLDFISKHHFNAIRLPVSLQAVLSMETLKPQGINTTVNPTLSSPDLTVATLLDTVVAKSRHRGLLILFDMHTHVSGGPIEESWITPQYSEDAWTSGLLKLASRYKDQDNVFGIDLKNEPHGNTTWHQWASAAERMALEIHKVNPKLLIFVEGVEISLNPNANIGSFWGGNMADVMTRPVKLSVPNKLVYSPHIYGPDVFVQRYFQDSDFPKNMQKVWEIQWGFIKSLHLGTIVVGEWGGQYRTGSLDETWQNAFGFYLRKKRISSFYWCLNPNSGDTKGLLLDDWKTPNARKITLLQKVHPTPTRFIFT